MEIERKFLLGEIPAGMGRLRWRPIRQGYLTHGDGCEIRIRNDSGAFFLTCKEGSGLVRKETEVRIDRRQFESLWTITAGRRLEKERAALKVGACLVEIDRYLGALAPLCVAEVEFPSVEASTTFAPPDFFGRDITGDDDYSNASLAQHGLPSAPNAVYQAGAVPFLWRNGRLHLVVVTNSAQTRWILPKGCLEPDMRPQDVALLETAEEAGALGSIVPGRPVVIHPDGRPPVRLYPLSVSALLKKWPESGRRRRRVLPVEAALALLDEPLLADAIRCLLPSEEAPGPKSAAPKRAL